MRKFKDEFTVPVYQIERTWLRRLSLIGVVIPSFLTFLFVGIFVGLFKFFHEIYDVMKYYYLNLILHIWNGEKEN